MNTTVSIHRFNVEEYHRLTESNILREDDRVELVEGWIVDMTPIGSKHAACVSRLNRILKYEVADECNGSGSKFYSVTRLIGTTTRHCRFKKQG
ncbi:MAG: hypothetical protein HW390_2663 [Candidatus Brocadiaceae bacterium]|nr:hypothetical protein [Candidatus Brocadiaceae bacterium]